MRGTALSLTVLITVTFLLEQQLQSVLCCIEYPIFLFVHARAACQASNTMCYACSPCSRCNDCHVEADACASNHGVNYIAHPELQQLLTALSQETHANGRSLAFKQHVVFP